MRPRALKDLTKEHLNMEIQTGEHDPVRMNYYIQIYFHDYAGGHNTHFCIELTFICFLFNKNENK